MCRMNMANVEIALEIMGKGMGGIFVAIVVIMAAVMVLGKITGNKRIRKRNSRQVLPGGICRCSYPVSGWLNQWNEALDYLEGIRCLIFMEVFGAESWEGVDAVGNIGYNREEADFL